MKEYFVSLRCRIANLLLCLVLIWPIFHLYLTTNNKISPWKFAGFAMYATPSARISVAFEACDASSESLKLDPESIQGTLRNFRKQYRAYAGQYYVGVLSENVFDANPNFGCFQLDVVQRTISSASGRWQEMVRSYICRRDVGCA